MTGNIENRPGQKSLMVPELTPKIRALMIAELDYDQSRGEVYLSPRLSYSGKKVYEDLLREAFLSKSPREFAHSLANEGRLKPTFLRRGRGGSYVRVRTPAGAAYSLAAGEFNRYYMRAQCLLANERNMPVVEFYRFRNVVSPRAESERKIGWLVDATFLLEHLRKFQGFSGIMGLPPGPNSGLSVRLPG